MKRLLVLLPFAVVGLLIFAFADDSAGEEEKKRIHIIRGKSTHQPYSHNNDEVGLLIKSKLESSPYADQFEVTDSFQYPEDLSLIENADLVIISSDGGVGHALNHREDPTKHTSHLDSVLKKGKTGLIAIHWAVDAPSTKFGRLHPKNAEMMIDWIGAVYYWAKKGEPAKSSWTWKFPVLELTVNQEHPISNGVSQVFRLQDEFYFNLFTEGDDSRNPKTDRVTFLHTTKAPDGKKQVNQEDTWREQSCYWAFTRDDGGRSVAMTSAHMYHTWANPNFFQSFVNSLFWTLDLPIPEDGVAIETPTIDELLSINDQVKIYGMARHFDQDYDQD